MRVKGAEGSCPGEGTFALHYTSLLKLIIRVLGLRAIRRWSFCVLFGVLFLAPSRAVNPLVGAASRQALCPDVPPPLLS